MQTVRDGDGRRYLRLKRSAESSLVRDPRTGEERYLPNDELTVVDGEPALSVAARAVPGARRRLLRAVRDDATLGLLVLLADRGPLPVRRLLDATDCCESDLHGRLGELRAAGAVEEVRVAGERGYDATEEAAETLAALRE